MKFPQEQKVTPKCYLAISSFHSTIRLRYLAIINNASTVIRTDLDGFELA